MHDFANDIPRVSAEKRTERNAVKERRMDEIERDFFFFFLFFLGGRVFDLKMNKIEFRYPMHA